MRFPPPLLFVVTFFAGVGLQRLAPIGPGPAGLADIAGIVGFVAIAAGLLLMVPSVLMFVASRTTIIPFRKASHLQSRGPYRFTRNPMYLGLVLVYLGVAGVRAEAWPLILLPVPVLVMHRVVIPFEEARLREIFSEAFAAYCARVRRWI